MKRLLPGVMVAVLVMASLRTQSGCASEVPVAPPATDGGIDVDAQAARDSSVKDARVPNTPGEREGWVTWNEYDPKCRFQVPTERKYLPEPLEWEACQETEVTKKLSCRRIRKKWEGIPQNFISPATTMFARNDGSLALTTVQYTSKRDTYVVAEIDGPMKVAVDVAVNGECILSAGTGRGSRYIFQVFERDTNGKWSGQPSGIGGHIDELMPRSLLRRPRPEGSQVTDTLIAGNAGFVLNSGVLEVYSWDEPPSLARTISGGSYSFVGTHEDFFWYRSSAPSATARIWTPEGGDQLVSGNGSDYSRATADLGTDGKDWVWGEGEGRTTAGFPTVKIVSAPFTRDPSKLQKRVVRNDLGPGAFATVPFQVGHGYAGHLSSRPNKQEGAMVVRLADGAAWFVPGRPEVVDFQHVLAISKDEVFFQVRDEHGTNVYRVRLDSLGDFALPPAPN